MKQNAKKHKIKLSIFHEKKRERTPSTSSDEDDEKDKEQEETNKEHDEEEYEDKYTVKRKIEYKGTEYYVTGSNTIYNEDGDVVGVIDGDGEAQWNI